MEIDIEGHKRLVNMKTGTILCTFYERDDINKAVIEAVRDLKLNPVDGLYRIDVLLKVDGEFIWRKTTHAVQVGEPDTPKGVNFNTEQEFDTDDLPDYNSGWKNSWDTDFEE
jgi:hypothetical protein